MLVPSDLPPLPDGSPSPDTVIRLGGGFINPLNGEYNISFFMPGDIASGVYELRVFLDYSINPPSGGEYYKVSDADSVDAVSYTHLTLPTIYSV